MDNIALEATPSTARVSMREKRRSVKVLRKHRRGRCSARCEFTEVPAVQGLLWPRERHASRGRSTWGRIGDFKELTEPPGAQNFSSVTRISSFWRTVPVQSSGRPLVRGSSQRGLSGGPVGKPRVRGQVDGTNQRRAVGASAPAE